MYRAVARMLRGDVACLIAGAGVLAFVVTTNAQKLGYGTPSVGTPQVVESTVLGDRTARPTQTDREQGADLSRAIPRPVTQAAANGGPAHSISAWYDGDIAFGGIAGVDPFSSQATGFEVADGFAAGFIGGQVGWTAFAVSEAEGHIELANPATGDQHLRVNHDPAVAAPLDEVGAFSPNMHDSMGIDATVSVDVFITGSGRDYQVVPQSPSEGAIVTRVRFSRVANKIEVFDEIAPDPAGFVDTGAVYIPDQYVNLTIVLDNGAGTIEIFYDGVSIYTLVGGVPFGTAVQEVVLFGINGVDSKVPAFVDFDNYSVVGGLLPTGACCNTDGMDGCLAVSAPECASIADAFYLGDDVDCIDCPLVDPSCGPGAGDCLEPHDPDPGCDDIECCALVCQALAFCCLDGFGWTQDCVDVALDQFCIPDPACGVIATGSCTEAGNGTPFCDDTCGPAGECPGCCDTVCTVDPFCCDTTWDGACSVEAEVFCGCKPIDVPANDECIDAVEIFVGPPLAVSNICAAPGPPDHPVCNDGFAVGLGVDVWLFHVATFDGALNVTPVADDPAGWITQTAVYEGCDCNALIDPEPFVCAPFGGAAVVPVTNGTCYLIRLGGTFNGPNGTGTIELSAVPDACIAAANECLETAGTAGCNDLSCCAVVCQIDPDCCAVAWDQACADLAQTSCAPLPCPVALDTSGANVLEGEDCGLDLNGGCNTDPAPPFNFTPIVSGDVVHGTAWADVVDLTPSRDTDWYSLTIDPGTDVNQDGLVDVYYSVVSELPIVGFMIRDINPICDVDFNDPDLISTTAYGQSCACINPGVGTVNIADVIYIFAGTGEAAGGGIFEGYPCPVGPSVFGNNYLLSVDVVDNGDPNPQTCGVTVKPCPWDCEPNPEGTIGINDFLEVLSQWGTIGSSCDFAGDPNGVGINAFLAILASWGPCP